MNLVADRGLYPVNADGTPQVMISGQKYEWPYFVVTNQSDQDLPGGTANDPGHLIYIGLMQPDGDTFIVLDVSAWFLPKGFPADTSVYGERLEFDFPSAQEVPPGDYYWLIGFYLTESGERQVGPDVNWSDDEYFLLSPVQVRRN